MKPEQAWNACLSQLHMEMPKAAFDTWVRDTEYLGYEDGVFHIGACNEYTCAWLKSRLVSMATRLLTGIMNRQVEVNFTVLESNDQTPIPPFEESRQPTSTPDSDELNLRVQVIHQSLRESIVQPGRVVMIPGYFKRWLPYLGPGLAWIVVAFRQVMYLATGNLARPRVEFEASPTAIARWAGIDRSTLWRHLNDPQLGWFVSRLPGHENRWIFQAGMPLTPGDADCLYALLNSSGSNTDPLAALDKALAIDPADLLPYPALHPRPEHFAQNPAPLNVQDVVLRACGKLDKATLKQVLEKADQLALRLAPPTDRIYVSHYFLLNWLPYLGAAPAWLVTLMRDRCYITRREMRDEVWIWGGYPEIAAMLGITRPKTIGEWLKPVFDAPERSSGTGSQRHERQRRRDAKRDLLGQFLQRHEYLEGQGFLAWRFKVALLEPLVSEDQAEYDQVLDLLGEYLESGDRQVIEALIREHDEGANATPGGAFATCEGAIATPPGSTKARMQHTKARLQHFEGAIATR